MNIYLSLATLAIHNKFKDLVKRLSLENQEGYIYAIERMGDLFTTPDNTLYHITSSYCHEILYSEKYKDLSISAIIYPSVANNQNSINWAIHPSFVDSDNMELHEVFELSLEENNLNNQKGNIRINVHKKRKFYSGRFDSWKVPNYKLIKVDFQKLQIKTNNNSIIKGKEVYLKSVNESNKTVKDLVNESIDFINLPKSISEMLVNENEESFLDFKKREYTSAIILKFPNGNKILTKDGISCIPKIYLPINWIKEYIALNQHNNY